jgi:hypothetical protein
MKFHAIKAIPRGREVLGDYERDTFAIAARRKSKLVVHYGFVCKCEACEPRTDFWGKSDERRRSMADARAEVRKADKAYTRRPQQGEAVDLPDPSIALSKLEGLLAKEGIVGATLADTYKSMVKWAKRHGQTEDVRKWMEREKEVCETCFGTSSSRAEDLRSQLENCRT